jgi:hypothetical protein
LTIAAPIPLAAPVTSATRPLKCFKSDLRDQNFTLTLAL